VNIWLVLASGLNLVAPALFVAGLLAWVAPRLGQPKTAPQTRRWLRQAALNALIGSLALLLGLAVFGHDGKMLSYAGMVLACASSQWVLSRWC
jgi:hypothetical protein